MTLTSLVDGAARTADVAAAGAPAAAPAGAGCEWMNPPVLSALFDLTLDVLQTFLNLNNFTKRKGTKAGRTMRPEDADAVEDRFFLGTAFIVNKNSIPKGLCFNFDETGISLGDVGKYTMAETASKQVRIIGIEDKRQITVVTATSADAQVLPLGVILPAFLLEDDDLVPTRLAKDRRHHRESDSHRQPSRFPQTSSHDRWRKDPGNVEMA